MKYTAIS